MLRISQISEKEEKELLRMTRQEKGYIALRAQIILWAYKDQMSVPELARRMGWTEERVRHWIKRYLKGGSSGLYDRPGRGRRPKRTHQVEEQIDKVLQAKPPLHTGYVCWTISLLVGWLIATFGIKVHSSTMRRWVHSLDFRWGRPKIDPISNDPEKELKLAKIEGLLETVKFPDVALFVDETVLRLLPVIRGMWMKIGEQLRIPVGSGWNKSIKAFGALNALTGQWNYNIFDKCNAVNFTAFLEEILKAYPIGHIYIILDRASWHRALLVQDWLTTHPRIEFVWLPKGCPKLNPVERIWRRLKDQVAANHWYGTLRAIRKAAEAFLDSLSPERASRIAKLAA